MRQGRCWSRSWRVIVWPDHSGWDGLDFCVRLWFWVGSDQMAGAAVSAKRADEGHGCEGRHGVTGLGETSTRRPKAGRGRCEAGKSREALVTNCRCFDFV